MGLAKMVSNGGYVRYVSKALLYQMLQTELRGELYGFINGLQKVIPFVSYPFKVVTAFLLCAELSELTLRSLQKNLLMQKTLNTLSLMVLLSNGPKEYL